MKCTKMSVGCVIVLMLLVVLGNGGCHKSDGELAKQLVGTWELAGTSPAPINGLTISITFNADGTVGGFGHCGQWCVKNGALSFDGKEPMAIKELTPTRLRYGNLTFKRAE